MTIFKAAYRFLKSNVTMPAHVVVPRAPFPLQTPYINGTSPTSVAPGGKPAQETETPTYIPAPVYQSVTVLPALKMAPTTSQHSEIPQYSGDGAALLQGYCTEPGYTILDGPTALWVPVIGCISSKADCCPTSTMPDAKAPISTGAGNPGGIGGGAGAANFPVSFLPTQGTLTGCPKDYHTVGSSACCPSSYWLWTAAMGGQVPCYSSLKAAMTPPPIPGDLVQEVGATTGTPKATALSMSRKPTSAIVNVAYAMQYPMVSRPKPKPTIKKEAKIGMGVGVCAAVMFVGILTWLLLRRFRKRSRDITPNPEASASQRFDAQVDMSRVAHAPTPLSRTYEGAKYGSVSTQPVGR